ncbi:germination protein, Ger(x)C family [Paenibacillus vortex V453]|uniref:Spore gernimation protein GerC n=2 Tax=Paenibacillus TaxID=44249 RepID=A0A163E541_9BACL|nr:MULTISPECIES: Ger(x)C family spore germination protein [Paenibacillus]EFU39977.1 germination protein, Ger(x)C family [Paenibacillus vortex V453]KZS43613.1 spore gernimation protein GerC [Paenibacillus glucanolyticus]MPY18228.1 Ger(x)C family spore germination protein [Paenibacillus glucanolyticus]
MRRVLMLVGILSFLLTGCWDNKEVQDINYITALGVDYKDGNYIIYVQMLDFATIAKQESGKQTEKAPIWVGRGTGTTLAGALVDLYTSSQQRVSWGHVTALVLTEAVLKPDQMSQVFDLTNRSQEIRYTKWVYGTQDSMEDLFTVSPFFQLSPLHSLLHEPKESYDQFSFIRPIQFVNFIRLYRERAATVVLPSIHISSQNWSENLKQHPILEVSGAFMIKNQKLMGWLSRSDLLGTRWLASPHTHASIIVQEEGEAIGSISLEKPQSSIEIIREPDDVAYRIKLNVTGTVQNMYKKVGVSEMKRLTEATLKKEMHTTFHKAALLKADPYELCLQLYRTDPKLWKKLVEQKKEIHDASLRELEVDVNLRFWGQRKNLNR